MKYKKALRQLDLRRKAFDDDANIKKANTMHPGSYHRPGSIKKK